MVGANDAFGGERGEQPSECLGLFGTKRSIRWVYPLRKAGYDQRVLFATELGTRCAKGEDQLAEDETEVGERCEDEIAPETDEGADDRGEEVEDFEMGFGVVGGWGCDG